MDRLLYGTGNKAKLNAMREWLKDLPIKIDALEDIVPDVPEDGKTPLQNARQKAAAYYAVLLRPVFSCDSGLIIQDVPEEMNPGVHARRPQGKSLSDGEMISYYAQLAKAFGHNGLLHARYQNAICLVINENTCFEHDGEDICSDTFLLADKPHPMRTPGWPLDSLSVSAKTGMYWFDMPLNERLSSHKDLRPGFENFFTRALNL
jgi:XTP/dITP diphosphohydrolase